MHDFRSQSIASNTAIVPDCFMPIAIRVFDGICYFGCLIRWCDFCFLTCLIRMLVLSEFKPVGSEDVFANNLTLHIPSEDESSVGIEEHGFSRCCKWNEYSMRIRIIHSFTFLKH